MILSWFFVVLIDLFILRYYIRLRSSCPEVFCKKGVLRNFVKLTGKHLCQSLFFNKVVALRPATLLKKRLWHRHFPTNFAKFLRTPFLQNTPGGCFYRLVNLSILNTSIFFKLWRRIYSKRYGKTSDHILPALFLQDFS